MFSFSCLSFFFCTCATAASIQLGDILISEVMTNPSAVSDSSGEWFEIFNASATTIDLNGITIRDDGSSSHTISANSPLFIAPGAYFVLGNNGDESLNGGYIANYVYSGFSLTNSSDQIVLVENNSEIARLDYAGAPFGISGISAELINQVLNPAQNNYAATANNSAFQFGNGDFGTPGIAGSVTLTAAPPVPIPGAIWLFGTILLLGMRKLTKTQRPINSHISTFNL